MAALDSQAKILVEEKRNCSGTINIPVKTKGKLVQEFTCSIIFIRLDLFQIYCGFFRLLSFLLRESSSVAKKVIHRF